MSEPVIQSLPPANGSFAIESPATDPYQFGIHVWVQQPMYIIGFFLNDLVLLGLWVGRRTLLIARTEQIMGLLAAVSLMWSILIPTKFWLDVAAHSYSTREEFESEWAKVQLEHQIEAALLASIISFIFALNLLLAMSRWTTINGISAKRQQLYDCIVLAQPILVSCISIWVFATSTSSQGVTPDLALQGLVWSATMGTTFVTNISGIIIFY
ncbi:hypothetical protein HDU98_003272, partial [Podochytrium sp. JEL0797]